MIIHDVEQRSPEWESLRRCIPTSSEFSKIITAVKGDLSSQAEAYMFRLLDKIERPDVVTRGFTSEHIERGIQDEQLARNWYRFTHPDEDVVEVGFVTNNEKTLGCSPDAMVIASHGIEIKCPDGPTHLKYLYGNKLPDEYKQQVHGSLAITRLDEWRFVSFCRGYTPLCISIYPDEYTEKVRKALKEFVERFELVKKTYYEKFGGQ